MLLVLEPQLLLIVLVMVLVIPQWLGHLLLLFALLLLAEL
tara:strand:+ start:225 stop:344 length:120 start_codon:yes stop_codon:yes gene_type:complete